MYASNFRILSEELKLFMLSNYDLYSSKKNVDGYRSYMMGKQIMNI
jgi:hypothetical protein